jgi:AcrB/AcrD/AcrF family
MHAPEATERQSAPRALAPPSTGRSATFGMLPIAGWFNQQRAILLAIQRQPGANVIETVNRINAMMPILEASIPPAVKVNVVSDRTQTIRASVADVQFTLLLTVALVVALLPGLVRFCADRIALLSAGECHGICSFRSWHKTLPWLPRTCVSGQSDWP